MNQSDGRQKRGRRIWAVIGVAVLGVVLFAINRIYKN